MSTHEVEWTSEKITRFWDYLAAHDTSEFFSEKHAHDIARRVPGRRVVDIGAGTGALVRELRRRGKDAVGVDTSPGPDVLEGSVTALPLPDGSMDAATLIEVVEHLDDATLDACIREAYRVLAAGGTLVITTPNAEDLAQNSRECPDCHAVFHLYQHVRRWTADSLRAYLEERGFSAQVRGVRFVEAGPRWERGLRRAWYRFRRQEPRLLASGRRGA